MSMNAQVQAEARRLRMRPKAPRSAPTFRHVPAIVAGRLRRSLLILAVGSGTVTFAFLGARAATASALATADNGNDADQKGV
jgi:hypothetical protein